MEQIQIRQPKMPAAQSFIQILGTFLSTLFIFIVEHFSFIKNIILNYKTAKPTVITRLILKNKTLFIKGENINWKFK